MAGMKKLTLGFIGNGKSTNRYHLPFVLQRKDKLAVKTIYQRNLAKQEWERLPGVNYTDDLEALLSDKEIQAIVITTPIEAHYEMIRKVLEAGKHCVCEKPFLATSAEAREMFDLAKAKGLMLQCYQNRRFDSDFLTLQKVIESGKLGDILEVENTYDYYRPYVPEGAAAFDKLNSYLYDTISSNRVSFTFPMLDAVC